MSETDLNLLSLHQAYAEGDSAKALKDIIGISMTFFSDVTATHQCQRDDGCRGV